MAEAAIYRWADEEELALFDAVKGEYHAWLDAWDVGLIFVNQPRTVDGLPAAATANILSRANGFLAGLDGYVEVCELYWDGQGEEYQRFLLDHEFSHFAENDKGRLVLVGHPFADFPEVLERHSPSVTGLWQLLRQETSPANHPPGRSPKPSLSRR
ncbi:MAG: hypothetical protein M1337_02705 [Actinobacteria bacterium]|nr:hypothetical protein [Actinomycetota bacterium]